MVVDDILIQYIMRNMPGLFLAVIFTIFTSMLYFKELSLKKRIFKWAETFLVSIYSVSFVSLMLSYQLFDVVLGKYGEMSTTTVVLITTIAQILPFPLFVSLYHKVVNNSYLEALFLYSLTSIVDYVAMLIADTLIGRLLIGVVCLIMTYRMFYSDLIFLKNNRGTIQSKSNQIVTWYLSWVGIVCAVQAPRLVMEIEYLNYDSFVIWIDLIGIIFYFSTMLVTRSNMETLRRYESSQRIRYRDNLTGLLNLEFYNNYAKDHIDSTKNLVVVYFDILNFREFNEAYGVTSGDEVLLETANILQHIFADDMVFRFFNDHFGIIVNNKEDLNKKLDEAHMQVHNMERKISLQLKAGLYLCEELGNNLTRKDMIYAYDCARDACRTLKYRRDMDYCYYDSRVGQRIEQERYLVRHFDTALEDDEIEVFYQPIIELETGHCVGFEALSRWNNPRYGRLFPEQYLNCLTEARLVHKLDQHVIKCITNDYKMAREKGLPLTSITINLSRDDFDLCNILDDVQKAAEKANMPSDLLTIEITESSLTKSGEVVHKAIEECRKKGFELWLDDFGSGYSSLNLLKDFDLDGIKLDLVFLQDDSEKSRIIVEATVNMCNNIGMSVTAEGIESLKQLEFIKKTGSKYAQGYYFARPEPYEKAVRVLKQRNIVLESKV